MVSSSHQVCANGYYIAIVSATVETSDPEAEIKPAIDLLGGVLEMFVQVSDLHEPSNKQEEENLYITPSYDATSHFETASTYVFDIYKTITGEALNLDILPTDDDEEY